MSSHGLIRAKLGLYPGCGAGLGPGQTCAVPGLVPDRIRVSERLQAAVAALTELNLLKERYRDMVNRALRDQDHQGPADRGATGRTETEDRLEETLSSLKQQLCHMRRQDIGLQSHLQQLGVQISELRVDVRRASEEKQEADSRPSSGFFDLSDSLSTSSTSVYSESLTSSQSSLLRPLSPPLQSELHRRRSADETSTKPRPPRASGVHLGSSRIRASPAYPVRQRPVSTGDLDWILAQGLSTVDPKFQTDLVSNSGSEVYRYPSPLHAVALQSPVFFQGGGTIPSGPQEGLGPPRFSPDPLHREQPGPETRTLGHMDKLPQSTRIQTKPETLRDKMAAERLTTGHGASLTGPAQSTNLVRTQRRACMMNARPKLQAHLSQSSTWCQSTPAVQESISDEVPSSSLRRTKEGQHGPVQRLEKHEEPRTLEPGQRLRPGLNCRLETSSAPAQFVLAHFVPAGSQRVRVRPGDRKTKPLRLKKPRGPRTRETRSKGDHRRLGRGTQKTSEELRPKSGSDSSSCSPGLHKIHMKPPLVHAAPQSRRVYRSQSPDCCENQIQTSWMSRESQVSMLCSARPGQTGLQGSFRSSGSSALPSLDSRYPPGPIYRSSLNWPHCESEYSGDCGSLIQSTIYDNTSNHYGDQETSCRSESESDSSLSLDQDHEDQDHSGLIWTVPRHEAFSCRIKASRALKKKIRRFQPASLKIMTLV
ncbi:dapper homolog 2 [Cheilinus undulatus]|uniref:dapper homolog 2 n=1 Tax=Cheilinus undulatus TaxID=241271 RepID=UPI001BD32226|nr:dapper homolog 2 [Cheilinus undulatus]